MAQELAGRGRVALGGLREALRDVLRQVADGQHLEVHHERRREAPRQRRPARAPQAPSSPTEPREEPPRSSPRGARAQAPLAEADVRDLRQYGDGFLTKTLLNPLQCA